MKRLGITAPEGVIIKAVLEGCPDDLASGQKIKILHNGGYEHFERIELPEFGPEQQATFRWVMRTKIAE
jgi:hypothetical protein